MSSISILYYCIPYYFVILILCVLYFCEHWKLKQQGRPLFFIRITQQGMTFYVYCNVMLQIAFYLFSITEKHVSNGWQIAVSRCRHQSHYCGLCCSLELQRFVQKHLCKSVHRPDFSSRVRVEEIDCLRCNVIYLLVNVVLFYHSSYSCAHLTHKKRLHVSSNRKIYKTDCMFLEGTIFHSSAII